ncbi:MAG TPA: glycosyltransferase family 4 protein [Acetobacteraceae bacterium]|nr:glycosyltransferase family 4 protein [Acetobacteraceae bacterium]
MHERPIRLLTFSTLFPHAGRPNHGIFVENRLRHLLSTGQVVSTVIAPVPWFPSRSPRFGEWARHAEAGRTELRDGLAIHHPRYALPPRVGMLVAPASLFLSGSAQLRNLVRRGFEFDLIDAHYLYPDGVAAVALGKLFRKPVVVTARGSDVTQFPNYAGPRRMIGWAMAQSAALISVSAGLRQAMLRLGADPEKVTVLRNGVDLRLFRALDRDAIRAELGLTGPVLLSVGHLIARKRHHFAIEALARLPEWRLLILGEGPERGALEALARRLGVEARVDFKGALPHAVLPRLYNAADVLILASSREGWANVLLEAMACGTPVVASDIPGNPEVVQAAEAGAIVSQNTPECFADTIRALYANRPSREATRAYAEEFSWDATSAGQLALFRRVLAEGRGSRILAPEPSPARG